MNIFTKINSSVLVNQIIIWYIVLYSIILTVESIGNEEEKNDLDSEYLITRKKNPTMKTYVRKKHRQNPLSTDRRHMGSFKLHAKNYIENSNTSCEYNKNEESQNKESYTSKEMFGKCMNPEMVPIKVAKGFSSDCAVGFSETLEDTSTMEIEDEDMKLMIDNGEFNYFVNKPVYREDLSFFRKCDKEILEWQIDEHGKSMNHDVNEEITMENKTMPDQERSKEVTIDSLHEDYSCSSLYMQSTINNDTNNIHSNEQKEHKEQEEEENTEISCSIPKKKEDIKDWKEDTDIEKSNMDFSVKEELSEIKETKYISVLGNTCIDLIEKILKKSKSVFIQSPLNLRTRLEDFFNKEKERTYRSQFSEPSCHASIKLIKLLDMHRDILKVEEQCTSMFDLLESKEFICLLISFMSIFIGGFFHNYLKNFNSRFLKEIRTLHDIATAGNVHDIIIKANSHSRAKSWKQHTEKAEGLARTLELLYFQSQYIDELKEYEDYTKTYYDRYLAIIMNVRKYIIMLNNIMKQKIPSVYMINNLILKMKKLKQDLEDYLDLFTEDKIKALEHIKQIIKDERIFVYCLFFNIGKIISQRCVYRFTYGYEAFLQMEAFCKIINVCKCMLGTDTFDKISNSVSDEETNVLTEKPYVLNLIFIYVFNNLACAYIHIFLYYLDTLLLEVENNDTCSGNVLNYSFFIKTKYFFEIASNIVKNMNDIYKDISDRKEEAIKFISIFHTLGPILEKVFSLGALLISDKDMREKEQQSKIYATCEEILKGVDQLKKISEKK